MATRFDVAFALQLLDNLHIYKAGAAGPDGVCNFNAVDSLILNASINGVAVDPRNAEIIGVLEHLAAGTERWISARDIPMAYVAAGNVLTVQNAGFTATSSFTVLYTDVSGSNKDVLWLILDAILGGGGGSAGAGSPGIYHSPDDFAAAWTTATTLTLTGIPFVPSNEQFIMVVEHLNTGAQEFFSPSTAHPFTYVPGTGVLTVGGATFDATSEYRVVILGQHKAFDPVLNALQEVILNARAQDFIDNQEVIDQDLGVSAPADSGWINVKGQTFMRLFYDWTSGAGVGVHNLLITMVGESTDAGVVEYIELAGPTGTTTAGPATAVLASELIQVTGYTRVKIYADESGGTGKGLINVRVTMMNR